MTFVQIFAIFVLNTAFNTKNAKATHKVHKDIETDPLPFFFFRGLDDPRKKKIRNQNPRHPTFNSLIIESRMTPSPYFFNLPFSLVRSAASDALSTAFCHCSLAFSALPFFSYTSPRCSWIVADEAL